MIGTPEQIELAALSSLGTAAQVVAAVSEGVTPQSFQVTEHAAVWEYLVLRANQGEDATSADVRLVCGLDLLPGVTDDGTLIAALVRQSVAARTRQAIYRRAPGLNDNPVQALQELLGDLGEVAMPVTQGHARFFDADAERRLAILLDKIEKRSRGEAVGIPTGLPTFDDNGDTWKPGEVASIMGATNAGKSWLLLYLAAHAYWKHGAKVLFLSPENTVDDIEFRLDAIIGRWLGFQISNRAVRNGTQDPEIYRAFIEAVQQRKRRDWITRDSGEKGDFTVADIVTAAREHRPDILAIDGFHLLRGGGSSWENIMSAAKTLKGLAQDMGMVVLAVSQAQRSATVAQDETPELGHAAYGLALVEASNRVISLAEKSGDAHLRVFKVPKFRDGIRVPNKRYLVFDVDVGNIHEVDDTVDEASGLRALKAEEVGF